MKDKPTEINVHARHTVVDTGFDKNPILYVIDWPTGFSYQVHGDGTPTSYSHAFAEIY